MIENGSRIGQSKIVENIGISEVEAIAILRIKRRRELPVAQTVPELNFEVECEADVNYEILEAPLSRKPNRTDHRSFDNSSGFVERPGTVRGCISCGRCNINETQEVTEMGPYGAENRVRAEIEGIKAKKCQLRQQSH